MCTECGNTSEMSTRPLFLKSYKLRKLENTDDRKPSELLLVSLFCLTFTADKPLDIYVD